ncbi:2-oxoacid:ferredoxin oxidoreductase subunit beta [Rhodovulum strictum]|uniref:2-oxoacid:ferredoxin oxidoreductase subunit beta n=1 Tax=Rhodovulum strictum TaxID=58314 RepID=A0A844BFB7_9RHOB|nr:2-oxoacid:ferredoxin oxidoreductase subunit beta [Rhodovulum strictum]MRH20055.1 2-oxoacid:ferredoxin oxidoreductase subunit beta [Rhodovulum strictum]
MKDTTEATAFDVNSWIRQEQMPHFLCPGCGHGIALRALVWALHEQGIDKDKLAVVSGIGCSGRLSAYIDANTFHTTHGRPLTFATGLKLARPDLSVVVITGDGDCLAIGGNHLIHAARRNLDITCLMLNNEIYGMTGGQVSPTTAEGRYTSTTPQGNTEPGFDACALAAAAGAGFVGREVTMQVLGLRDLIGQAIAHKGFSFVEVLSDCTEIYGRKNDLGASPEMMLAKKSEMRPFAYRNTVDVPFRPNHLRTGVIARSERPEYGAAYRAMAAGLRGEGGDA